MTTAKTLARSSSYLVPMMKSGAFCLELPVYSLPIVPHLNFSYRSNVQITFLLLTLSNSLRILLLGSYK